jgi:release factor glutamine methyltransferase
MRINDCIPRVIDVGSGTGILAIIAAARALKRNISPWVIAIDHDYNASMNTRINIINNGLHNYADVVSTTVLNAIKHGIHINIIVSNPPYLPGDWREDWRIFGGPDGNYVIRQLINRICNIKVDIVVLTSSSLSNWEEVVWFLRSCGYKLIIIKSIHYFLKILLQWFLLSTVLLNRQIKHGFANIRHILRYSINAIKY